MLAFALAVVLAPPVLVCGGVSLWLVLHHLGFARWHRRAGRPVPLAGGQLLAYWAVELAATLRILWWRLLWRLRRPRVGGAGRPVVCVHGFGGAAGDMLGIVKALAAHGRAAYSIRMGPALAPVERWAGELADGLRELLEDRDPDEGVDIVAHSMGGLVARVLLEKYPEVGARVRTLVTLGSPHEGTAIADRFAIGQAGPQMRRGSTFLRDLPRPADVSPKTRVLTFGAVQDYIVYPSETCRLEGAPHHTLPVGHSGLVASSRSIDRVVEALSESQG